MRRSNTRLGVRNLAVMLVLAVSSILGSHGCRLSVVARAHLVRVSVLR